MICEMGGTWPYRCLCWVLNSVVEYIPMKKQSFKEYIYIFNRSIDLYQLECLNHCYLPLSFGLFFFNPFQLLFSVIHLNSKRLLVTLIGVKKFCLKLFLITWKSIDYNWVFQRCFFFIFLCSYFKRFNTQTLIISCLVIARSVVLFSHPIDYICFSPVLHQVGW